MGKTIEILGVPLDLGANLRGATMGPDAVRIAHLKKRIEDLDLTVCDSGDLMIPVRESLGEADVANRYLEPIASVCELLARKVRGSMEKGHFPLILGGDHSIAMGTITGLAQVCQAQNKRLGVVWIDAHADMNTPDSSPSGNIHGMPLSALLGTGHDRLVQLGGFSPKLQPDQVALIGIRNIDGKERAAVRESGVHYYTMRQVDELGLFRVMREVLDKMHADVLHLSCDMDGVDPLYAPGVSTPVSGGLSYREMHLALEMLADTGKLACMEFVELNPAHDTGHKTANLVVELALSALGKAIV